MLLLNNESINRNYLSPSILSLFFVFFFFCSQFQRAINVFGVRILLDKGYFVVSWWQGGCAYLSYSLLAKYKNNRYLPRGFRASFLLFSKCRLFSIELDSIAKAFFRPQPPPLSGQGRRFNPLGKVLGRETFFGDALSSSTINRKGWFWTWCHQFCKFSLVNLNNEMHNFSWDWARW